MANRLKRVFSTVLCATVMLTMTAVPGSVFAQTDADSSEQPETTAQTENQVTTPETKSGGVTQEPKQAADQSKEAAEAPAKTPKAAQPQANKNEAKAVTQAAKGATGVTITTPNDKTKFCTGTSIKLTAKIKDRDPGHGYTYQWYKDGTKLKGEKVSTYTAKASGVYSVKVTELHMIGTSPTFTASVTVTSQAHEAEWYENGGHHYQHCKNCNTELSSAAQHTITKVDQKNPTCTEAGYKAYWTCSVCEYKFSDEKCINKIDAEEALPATGHKMTKTDAKAATCTENGNNEYYKCNKCNKVFEDEAGTTETTVAKQTLSATGHDMEKTDAKAATCTENGNNEYYKCNKCNKVFEDEAGTTETTVADQTLSATGHVMTKQDAVEPTCTKDGHVAYWTCSKCEKMFADEAGEKEITCPELTPATGHKLTGHDFNPATCTKNGNYEYYTCDKCDKIFRNNDMTFEFENEEATIIPATGHKFGEWTVKKPAAIGTEGLKERVCEKCGYIETAVIPALEASKTDLNNKTELAKKTAESKSAEEKTDNSAKTGDDSSIALYALLALLAAGGAAGTVYRRKTNE